MEKKAKLRPDVVLSSGFLSISAIMILCIVFYKITGAEGVGFLAAPLALFLLAYGMQIISFETVTRDMVKGHMHRKQMRTANKNVKRLLLISFISGLVIAIICAAFSNLFAKAVFHSTRSFFVLFMIAPIFLFMSIQGVLRGYLCGAGFSAASVFSNLIMVVITCVLSILFSNLTYEYGLKVNALMHVDDIASAYGAIGATLGITISCMISLLFVLIMVLVHKNELKSMSENDAPMADKHQERYYLDIIPNWLIFAQSALLLFVDECVYLTVAGKLHPEEDNIENWGIYIGQCVSVTILLIFICAVPFLKSWYSVHVSIVKREYKIARFKIQNLVHFESMLIFPIVIWIMVLASTITAILFGKTNESAVNIIVLTIPLAIPGAFLLFQTFLLVQMKNKILLGFNAVIGIIVHMVVLILMSTTFKFGIHASMAAFAAMIVIEAILGFFEIKMMLDYDQDIVRNILKPLLAAGVSGLVAMALDRLFVNLIGEILTLIISLIIAYLVYMVLLIVIRTVNRYELEKMPFGDQFALIYDRLNG